MDTDALWEAELKEAIQDFVEADLTFYSVSSFSCQLGVFISKQFHEPMPAARLALVHGNQDYLASIDEIGWIDDISCVVSCLDSSGHIIFAFDLDCDLEDYYIRCAAIVKIFNIAFEGNNFFIFKTREAVVLGCKRKQANIKDNFCVSQPLISGKLSHTLLGMVSELLQSELEEFGDIIDEYASTAAYEEEEEVPVSLESIEDTDDLEAVFQRIYGFDYQDEEDRARQLRREFGGDIRNPYEEARQELRYVGDLSSASSYDELEYARQAQERAEKVKWGENSDEGSSEQVDPWDGRFSRAAYGNAEIMLQEIMAQDDDDEDAEI